MSEELVNKEYTLTQEKLEFLDSFRQDVQALSAVNPVKSLFPLLMDWVVIAGAIATSLYLDSKIFAFFSLLVVAARQHALLVLVHEGAHGRLYPSRKWNDFFSNFFAAYPMFFCTEAYRAHHGQHHRFLNSQKDPDWARKIHLNEWQFPQSKRQLLGTFASAFALSWYRLLILFWGMFGISSKANWKAPEKRALILRKLAFYAAIGATLWMTGTFSTFAIYWLIPYYAIFPLFERVRSISEHFGLGHSHLLNSTRNMMAPAVESFFFGPHNINYHLIHHLYPTVPQYALPQLRERLLKEDRFVSLAHENSSYLWGGEKPLIRDLLRPSKMPPKPLERPSDQPKAA